MRPPIALLLVAASLPSLASAQAVIVAPPGYTAPYPGGGYVQPYAPANPGVRVITPFGNGGASGSVAAGAFPPGAQTCVAMDEMCPASAPNTVGNRCSCPGRDGRPIPGIVR